MAYEHPCPTCGAHPGQPCRSVVNRRVQHKQHKQRIAPRSRARVPESRIEFRRVVLARCGYRCELVQDGTRCDARATQAHHILPLSRGGTDAAENGMGLCAAHHAYIHNHPEWAYARGYLRRSTSVRVVPT